MRLRSGFAFDQLHRINIAIGRKPRAIRVRIRNRSRQRHALHIGRDLLQPRQGKAEQIAALAIGESMHLIDYHALKRRKHHQTVFVTKQ